MHKLNVAIGRSHSYWGSKPLPDLLNIFEKVEDGDIVLDPFCGRGNPALAALMRGTRVISSDLNPMGVFLTKVLIRPISIPLLKSAFHDVEAMVSESILEIYSVRCPDCKERATIDYLVWNKIKPEAAKISCNHCGPVYLNKLLPSFIRKQMDLSQASPQYWYPKRRIHSNRKPAVDYHYELFTGRNLSMLAELFNAINKISFENCRDALRYVFTAMLYSCSVMQMFSEKEPSSSHEWTALRFYLPPKRKEINVWKSFKGRFETFLKCKRILNTKCFVRITDSPDKFFSKKYETLICESDAFDLIKDFGRNARHVFLDPPYIEDIDYLAFSEFWGAWLRMKFNFKAEWQFRKLKEEDLKKILTLVNEITTKHCNVILALHPKYSKGWDMQHVISDSGYVVHPFIGFYYDNSNKRGGMDKRKDEFFILLKKELVGEIATDYYKSPSFYKETTQQEKIFPYLRTAGFLKPKAKAESIRSFTFELQLVPDHLHRLLQETEKEIIVGATRNKEINSKTYNSLCYAFISQILSKDGWKITYTDPSHFVDHIFGISLGENSAISSGELTKRSAFTAQKDNRRIHFCFDHSPQSCQKQVSREVQSSDGTDFKNVCVMIVRSETDMNLLRKNADKWPGGFFVCFEQIREKCEEINIKKYPKLCGPTPQRASDSNKIADITSVKAEVIDNIPVGGRDNPDHYKLRFQAPELPHITPGQFIMMDTSPQKRFSGSALVELDKLRSSFTLSPKAFLKRPFGIHRAYYPNFNQDYLKNLSLPPILATVMHTVYPHEFDIFYKVLESGVGTNEMKKLKKGQKIQITGPLGKRFNLRELRAEGFNEIHVIGGGVGMAPLVFMVQALRFFAFKVRTFIGIENFEFLKHKDNLFKGFAENPKDVKLYVHDLLAIGVDHKDIHVSCDKTGDTDKEIPKRNFHFGLVGEQYEQYLQKNHSRKNILAFTCGPDAMMRHIEDITAKYNIPLKVLMEKRMACGIGVCLSCVCKTKNGKGHYSRVCVEGPIFDANEIEWK